MSITGKAILISVGFLLFISAIWTAGELFNENHKALDIVDQAIYGRDRDLLSAPKIEKNGDNSVSGAIVLQTIRNISAQNADIQVNGVTFSKNLDIDETDVSMIDLSKSYRSQFIRDSKGIMTNIIFTSE